MLTHTRGFEKLGFDLSKVNSRGQTTCPFCSPHRKKSHVKCAKINMSTGNYECFHCGTKGRVDSNKWLESSGEKIVIPKVSIPDQIEKKDVVLTGEDMHPLTSNAVKYLTSRGFTEEYLASSSNIFSMDLYRNEAVCYATYERGVLKARKRRTISGPKRFHHEGSTNVPFNYSDINYLEPIFITEGEPDTLSMDMIGMQVWGLPVGAQEPMREDTSIAGKVKSIMDRGLETHPLVYILLDPDSAGYYTSKKIVEDYLPNARNLTQHLNVSKEMDLNRLLQMGKLFDCLKYLIDKT